MKNSTFIKIKVLNIDVVIKKSNLWSKIYTVVLVTLLDEKFGKIKRKFGINKGFCVVFVQSKILWTCLKTSLNFFFFFLQNLRKITHHFQNKQWININKINVNIIKKKICQNNFHIFLDKVRVPSFNLIKNFNYYWTWKKLK